MRERKKIEYAYNQQKFDINSKKQKCFFANIIYPESLIKKGRAISSPAFLGNLSSYGN